jgi:hypothetical protein
MVAAPATRIATLPSLADRFDAKASAYSARARATHEVGLGDDVVPVTPANGEAAPPSAASSFASSSSWSTLHDQGLPCPSDRCGPSPRGDAVNLSRARHRRSGRLRRRRLSKKRGPRDVGRVGNGCPGGELASLEPARHLPSLRGRELASLHQARRKSAFLAKSRRSPGAACLGGPSSASTYTEVST